MNEYKDNMDNPNCHVLGENKEDSYPGKKNTGWFTALKDVGSSKGVFFDTTMQIIKSSIWKEFTWVTVWNQVGVKAMQRTVKKVDC